MKTIREWLEELEEPYRSEAIANTPINVLKYTGCTILSNALIKAFEWGETKHSFDYWNDLHESIIKTEKDA